MFKVCPHHGRRGNVQIPQGTCVRAAYCGPVHDGGTVPRIRTELQSQNWDWKFLLIWLATPWPKQNQMQVLLMKRVCRVSIHLFAHSHAVGVMTSSYHSSGYHLPACLAVIWPMGGWLKAAGRVTDEQQDQPTVLLRNILTPGIRYFMCKGEGDISYGNLMHVWRPQSAWMLLNRQY